MIVYAYKERYGLSVFEIRFVFWSTLYFHEWQTFQKLKIRIKLDKSVSEAKLLIKG